MGGRAGLDLQVGCAGGSVSGEWSCRRHWHPRVLLCGVRLCGWTPWPLRTCPLPPGSSACQSLHSRLLPWATPAHPPLPGPVQYKAAELGMKLTAGFEMLAAAGDADDAGADEAAGGAAEEASWDGGWVGGWVGGGQGRGGGELWGHCSVWTLGCAERSCALLRSVACSVWAARPAASNCDACPPACTALALLGLPF